ncbi:O-methyltransferase [Amycolatopsis palatopharyngis]|uniref:O-methyltransferase n=1 Tax=Amycolatopsis palatopharyngis TaxID=187982 RepID=UPI000E26AD3C|nr:O-methyltransferase [Amycolatopsis palatopharyngis]
MTSETHTTGSAGLGDLIEGFLPEDDPLTVARLRAQELGCPSVDAASGAALCFLAAALQARAVVEIGTGGGVSGLHLLRGMAKDGILTSIDIEPEYHRAARTTFSAAGFAPGRTRLIMGRALDVLPRLTSGGYDLVFVDAARVEYPLYYEKGVQLLRPGGVIVFHNALADGHLGEPGRRDPETMALREVARAVREDERLVPALLPVGGGLLVAAAADH